MLVSGLLFFFFFKQKTAYEVRISDWSSDVCSSDLLDAGGLEDLLAQSRDLPLGFLCHHGGRSAQAADHFRAQGFSEVFNIAGGIDAWAQDVDPSVPRY